MATLIESCRISPPASGDVAHHLSLPLTFFDIRWIIFHPIRLLFFYEYPDCCRAHFLDTLVPTLKQSLSLTLKHYLPLAANLIVPWNIDEKPVFRYVSGDSVSLTIAESSTYGFDDLVGNHAREADQFYHFVPEMPRVKDEGEYKTAAPVVALKVTLFPGRGICIGFAHDHCVGDASSMVRFINAWASITKLINGGDHHDHYSSDQLIMPIFDRSVIKDPRGVGTLYWETVKTRGIISPFRSSSSSFSLPTNRVRATYTLHQADIESLKNLVFSAKRISGGRVSSYVVMAAYIWTCLVKSGEQVDDDNVAEPQLLLFAVDARARMDPPVPANYFSNCLSYGMAIVDHKQLVSEGGFVIAAEAIAEDIINGVNDKDQALFRAENWVSDMEKFRRARKVVVTGSPKFDFSEADFGWGRTRKFEVVSIDGENYSMSLCKSSSSDGGLEIGLSLPRERMEAFAAIFAQGLRPTPRASL